MAPVAPCRLGTQVATLRESHIIPAWCYERAKHDESGRVKQLLFYDGFKGTIAYSDRQLKEYLLCAKCEQAFSAGFENYVSTVAAQKDRSFPALANVTATQNKRIVSQDGSKSLYSSGSLDVDKLARFAASVIWRASISTHPHVDEVQLGPYEEPVREYLLNRTPLPNTVSVCMRLLTKSEMQSALFLPFSKRFAGGWMHQFLVNGLYFTVHVGQGVERVYRDLCITRGRWVSLDDAEDMAQLLAQDLRASTPKGKHAREV